MGLIIDQQKYHKWLSLILGNPVAYFVTSPHSTIEVIRGSVVSQQIVLILYKITINNGSKGGGDWSLPEAGVMRPLILQYTSFYLGESGGIGSVGIRQDVQGVGHMVGVPHSYEIGKESRRTEG